ncbi:hypothetical protein VYE96_12775 [Fusobacterium pseudoperiodonticum]|nr:hypothetical protein [Fusobacterium pseudoperiodonticum]
MTTKMDKVNRLINQEGGEDKCKIYVINSSDKILLLISKIFFQ